jgi:hypothetical protein
MVNSFKTMDEMRACQLVKKIYIVRKSKYIKSFNLLICKIFTQKSCQEAVLNMVDSKHSKLITILIWIKLYSMIYFQLR